MEKTTNKKGRIHSFLILIGVLAISFVIYSFVSSKAANDSGIADTDTANKGSKVIILDTDGFDSAIANGVVLVDFWATWCPPCRIQAPILEDLASEISHLATISKLDVDENRPIASRFGVRSIPTLILFKDGKEVERYVGVQQKETLRAVIENYL